MRRRDLLIGAAGLVAMPAAAAEPVRVNIPQTRTAFEPAEVTVKVGDTVRWRNRSIVEHSVVCDPAKAADPTHTARPKGAAVFDSGVLGEDGTFEHAFTVPGTYLYFCREHEAMGMLGKVIVTA